MKNPQTTRKLKVRRVCIWVVSHTARRIKSSQWLNKALLPSTSIAFSHKLCVHSQREIERERLKHKNRASSSHDINTISNFNSRTRLSFELNIIKYMFEKHTHKRARHIIITHSLALTIKVFFECRYEQMHNNTQIIIAMPSSLTVLFAKKKCVNFSCQWRKKRKSQFYESIAI